MDGVELLQELKVIGPEVPVILMSGHADMRTAVDALKKDVFDFLRKPVVSTELLKVMESALRRSDDLRNAALREAGESTNAYGFVLHSSFKEYPNVSVLHINSPLDERAAPRLENAFARMANDGILKNNALLSFKNVEYVNNVGLNYLIELDKSLMDKGHRVVFTQLSHKMHKYLGMLGYLDYFKIVPNYDEAVNTVAGSR